MMIKSAYPRTPRIRGGYAAHKLYAVLSGYAADPLHVCPCVAFSIRLESRADSARSVNAA